MNEFSYRRDIAKAQMVRYAEAWGGLPLPRLQLRWAPKPVAKRHFRKEQAEVERFARKYGLPSTQQVRWDCFYELVLPVERLDIRNEHYGVGFLIIPICWTRRTVSEDNPPCKHTGTDTPFRDSTHARLDSKELSGLPIFVVAPDGRAEQERGSFDAPEGQVAQ